MFASLFLIAVMAEINDLCPVVCRQQQIELLSSLLGNVSLYSSIAFFFIKVFLKFDLIHKLIKNWDASKYHTDSPHLIIPIPVLTGDSADLSDLTVSCFVEFC